MMYLCCQRLRHGRLEQRVSTWSKRTPIEQKALYRRRYLEARVLELDERGQNRREKAAAIFATPN